MKIRVRFNRKPSLMERLRALSAAQVVRKATQIALTIRFEPDVAPYIRTDAIQRLQCSIQHNAETMNHFQSPEALAVLAFMESIRAHIPGLIKRAVQINKKNPQLAAIVQRELDFYQTKLAVCALYMRRSGYMDQEMLGDALYKAATAIETIYGPVVREVALPNAAQTSRTATKST